MSRVHVIDIDNYDNDSRLYMYIGELLEITKEWGLEWKTGEKILICDYIQSIENAKFSKCQRQWSA